MDAPLRVGTRPVVNLRLTDAAGGEHEVPVTVDVRSCRPAGDSHLVGASIAAIEPDARMHLMEWCYVVCSHERLRGHRPGEAVPAEWREPIVVPVGYDSPQPAVEVATPQPAVAG
jgi:hypothetical protein